MLDPNVKNMITSVAGKHDVVLRCGTCKTEFVTKTVGDLLNMNDSGLQALGMSLFGPVGGHVCKR